MRVIFTDMNFTITSQNKSDYLLIESKGRIVTKAELFKHSQLVHEEIIRYDNKKILVYEPELHFPQDLFSYLALVHNYIDNFPPDIRLLKIAIVVSAVYEEIAKFWAIACQNRGFPYNGFTSLQEAHTWLTQ